MPFVFIARQIVYVVSRNLQSLIENLTFPEAVLTVKVMIVFIFEIKAEKSFLLFSVLDWTRYVPSSNASCPFIHGCRTNL